MANFKINFKNYIQEKKDHLVGAFTLAKHRLASHPEAKAEVLEKLAEKSEPTVVERVAENPQTSIEVLEKLAGHADTGVRGAVTENENTPVETIALLAIDESPDVRYRLAENHNAPLTVLVDLSHDENPYVSNRAEHTLQRIKEDSGPLGKLILWWTNTVRKAS